MRGSEKEKWECRKESKAGGSSCEGIMAKGVAIARDAVPVGDTPVSSSFPITIDTYIYLYKI